MRYRDRAHAPSETVYALFGLSDATVRALPGALRGTAQDPAGEALRTRWPAGRGGRTLSPAGAARAIDASIQTAEPGLGMRDLIVEVATRPFLGVPIKVAVSGHDVAISFAHAAFDATGILELLLHVVALASGEPHSLDTRPAHRAPSVRALRAVTRDALGQALADRRARAAARHRAHPPTDADLALRTAQVAHLRLDADTISAIRAMPTGADGAARASLNMRLCSLAVRALADVQRGELDLPVQLPVDLRRYVPDARVDGNFIGAVELGTLRGSDWGPARIAERTAAPLASGAPHVGMLISGLGPLRQRVRAALRRGRAAAVEPGDMGIAVTMLRMEAPFPDAAFAPDGSRRFSISTIGPWPSNTMVATSIAGPEVQLTVWNEDGQFDLDRFEEAFTARIGSGGA